jgi:hypothetical protein
MPRNPSDEYLFREEQRRLAALAEARAEDEQTHWEQDPEYRALYFPEEE